MDFFWNDRSVLRLVDLHAGIARRARRLQRHVLALGGKLTASDAVHLATASWLEVGIHSTRDSWNTTFVAQKRPECPSLEVVASKA
jgi:hypothetical protein